VTRSGKAPGSAGRYLLLGGDARNLYAAPGGTPQDPSNNIPGRVENHARTTIISGGTMSGLLQGFNLADEFNILRLICGLFFVPHIYAKFFVPEALGFFVAAKFKPPALWLYIACVIETVLAIGLVFGIYTTYAGAIAFIHLLVAAAAVWRVTGGKWLWN